MIEWDNGSEYPYRNAIYLYFDTRAAIGINSIGSLFSSLASDYKRFDSTAELIILRVESGSFRLWLGAAVVSIGGYYTVADKTIDGFNHLYDFSKNIVEIINRAHEGNPVPSGSGQRAGVKSAQAILEAALKSRSSLHLEYRGPDGEKITLDMHIHEIERAHQLVKKPSAMKRRKSNPQQVEAEGSTPYEQGIDYRLDAYAARRSQIPASARAQEDSALVVALGIFVETLEASGSEYVVETVAQKLEARGLYEIAMVLRQNRGEYKEHQMNRE